MRGSYYFRGNIHESCFIYTACEIYHKNSSSVAIVSSHLNRRLNIEFSLFSGRIESHGKHNVHKDFEHALLLHMDEIKFLQRL